MKINWGKPIIEGIKFSLHPKRWIYFFILDFLVISASIFVVINNLSSMAFLLYDTETADLSYFLTYFWPLFIFIVIYFLFNLLITGAVIHQSYKPKEQKKSWYVSGSKYPSLIAANLIIVALTLILSLVPYIGWLLGIVISIILFFTLVSIVLNKHGFYKGLKDSWNIFVKNPLRVFVAWLLIAVVSIVILFIFALPLIVFILSLILTAQNLGLAVAVLQFKNQLPIFVITGIILLIGVAILRVFSLKAQTDFYQQFKKKKFLGIF
jgi:hypothetical protein